MKKIYVDTSAILKVYHKEKDSDRILKILSDNISELYMSELAKLEFNSALWKKVRNGDASEIEAKKCIHFFESDYYKYKWVDIDRKIIFSAKNLINKYGSEGLKTLDSIQLACAVLLKDVIDEFLTSDTLLKTLFLKERLKLAT